MKKLQKVLLFLFAAGALSAQTTENTWPIKEGDSITSITGFIYGFTQFHDGSFYVKLDMEQPIDTGNWDPTITIKKETADYGYLYFPYNSQGSPGMQTQLMMAKKNNWKVRFRLDSNSSEKPGNANTVLYVLCPAW